MENKCFCGEGYSNTKKKDDKISAELTLNSGKVINIPRLWLLLKDRKESNI